MYSPGCLVDGTHWEFARRKMHALVSGPRHSFCQDWAGVRWRDCMPSGSSTQACSQFRIIKAQNCAYMAFHTVQTQCFSLDTSNTHCSPQDGHIRHEPMHLLHMQALEVHGSKSL